MCGKYLMSHTSTIFFEINPVFSPTSAWPSGLCAFFVLVIHSLNEVVFFYRTPPLPFYISPFLSCSLEPTQRIHIQNGLKRLKVSLHHTKACTIWISLLLFLHPPRCSDDILFPFFRSQPAESYSKTFTGVSWLVRTLHKSSSSLLKCRSVMMPLSWPNLQVTQTLVRDESNCYLATASSASGSSAATTKNIDKQYVTTFYLY